MAGDDLGDGAPCGLGVSRFGSLQGAQEQSAAGQGVDANEFDGGFREHQVNGGEAPAQAHGVDEHDLRVVGVGAADDEVGGLVIAIEDAGAGEGERVRADGSCDGMGCAPMEQIMCGMFGEFGEGLAFDPVEDEGFGVARAEAGASVWRGDVCGIEERGASILAREA